MLRAGYSRRVCAGWRRQRDRSSLARGTYAANLALLLLNRLVFPAVEEQNCLRGGRSVLRALASMVRIAKKETATAPLRHEPAAEMPSADDLRLVASRCLVRATRRVSNMVTRVFNVHFRPVGIEAAQFWILFAVSEEAAPSLTELADFLGVEKSTLARNLDRLISSGLVMALPGEGRRVRHRLTAAGDEMLTAALPCWERAQEEIELQLTTTESEKIRAGLKLLRHRARAILALDD
jgi:DNA-binding MarR family transcriptional regulator